MKQFFFKNIFHTYLVCLYIVLNAANVVLEFDIREFLGINLLFILFILFLYTFNNYVFKINKYKLSYIVTVSLFSFFFIHEIGFFLKEITTISFRLRYIVLFVLFILSLFSLFLFISKKEFTKINLYLNLLFLFYCGFEVYNLIDQKIKSTEPILATNPILTKENEIHEKPNVYFLMIDGYANNKSLKKYWAYDNTAFTDSLQKLGFKYIENSKSDYIFTIQTVASVLNLRNISKAEKKDFTKLLKKIRLNLFTSSLKKLGYDIFNLSIFSLNSINSPYTFWFGDYQSNIKKVLFHNSIIGRYFDKDSFNNSFNAKVKREILIDEQLIKIAKTNTQKPKFVFYHSLETHHPFDPKNEYYIDDLINNIESDKKGIQTLKNKDKDPKWMQLYLNHVKKSTKKTLNIVSQIVEQDPDCLILLFSDHGFRLTTGVLTEEARKEAIGNFCAVYIPKNNFKDLEKINTPTELSIYIYSLINV